MHHTEIQQSAATNMAMGGGGVWYDIVSIYNDDDDDDDDDVDNDDKDDKHTAKGIQQQSTVIFAWSHCAVAILLPNIG